MIASCMAIEFRILGILKMTCNIWRKKEKKMKEIMSSRVISNSMLIHSKEWNGCVQMHTMKDQRSFPSFFFFWMIIENKKHPSAEKIQKNMKKTKPEYCRQTKWTKKLNANKCQRQKGLSEKVDQNNFNHYYYWKTRGWEKRERKKSEERLGNHFYNWVNRKGRTIQ